MRKPDLVVKEQVFLVIGLLKLIVEIKLGYLKVKLLNRWGGGGLFTSVTGSEYARKKTLNREALHTNLEYVKHSVLQRRPC